MGRKKLHKTLFGCHWYSEGDVQLVVKAHSIQSAVEKFLATEYQLIVEEIGIGVEINHHLKYSGKSCYILIEVRQGKLEPVIIKGLVSPVTFPSIPKYVQELVSPEKTSIQTGSVTRSDNPQLQGAELEVYLRDVRSAFEIDDLT